MQYDPTKGQDAMRLGGSSVFVVAALYAFARLFARRADYFTKVKLAARSEDDALLNRTLDDLAEEEAPEEAARPPGSAATAGAAFQNAASVGAVSVALFALTSALDAYLNGVDLPDQYTVRQVGVLFRTVIVGLSYLACFIYGANSLGLLLLGVDMVRNPEKHAGEGERDELRAPAAEASEVE